MLPSETKYNHKWGNADDKWDRLDKLSHAGMPDEKDYFLCIARQIEIIGEVVEHIEELLKDNNSIIVTGDHGSSRLAALMFHVADNFAITPPKNAIVKSFGRFCEIKDDINVPTIPGAERVELNNETFIVMKTYEHFKQSGNAAGGNTDDNAIAGEVHGGMTPEEYLVPVIVISRKNPLAKQNKIENNKPKAANLNDMGI
jgi:arylsulfatase A-like enzyme